MEYLMRQKFLLAIKSISKGFLDVTGRIELQPEYLKVFL